jgi:hypothetical protein
MHRFRPHIACVAVVWFACQVGAISATSAAACHLFVSDGDAALPVCCRVVTRGQSCPMHGHLAARSSHACHIASSCPVDGVALLSLATPFGVTFAPHRAASTAPYEPLMAQRTPQTLVRAPRPRPHPPRA